MMPPNDMNCEIVSTSEVTRETSEPRRSLPWVSSVRSCTWRNALIRNVASPLSVARYSLRFIRTCAVVVKDSSETAITTAFSTNCMSGVGGATMPLSITCWIVIGMITFPTVANSASESVTPSPWKISGLSRRPRRSVEKPPSPVLPSALTRAETALTG